MTIGIYGLFDAQTDECLYVGLSTNIEDRYKQHLKLLRGKRHLRKDFIQWWADRNEDEAALMIKILEECTEGELNQKEIDWFNKMNPEFFGHKPSKTRKWEHSEETKKKIAEATQKKLFPQRCKKCSVDFHSIKKDQPLCKTCRASIRKKKSRKAKNQNFKIRKRRTVVYEQLLDNINEVKELADDKNITKNEACKSLSVGIRSLNLFLEEENIAFVFNQKRKRRTSPERLEYEQSIVDMYLNESMSTSQIAKVIGVTQPNVVQILGKYRETDERFAIQRVKRRASQKGKKMSDKHKEAFHKYMSEAFSCQHCNKEVKGKSNLNRHEAACRQWPHCKTCKKRLSRKDASLCKDHQYDKNDREIMSA